jgi:predicted transport protein
MPFFERDGKKLSLVKVSNFKLEKELQSLIEENVQTVFNCRFIASEFHTGNDHAGRIDTLALSEDSNPVIIEYKKVESSELINQSLFYLSWIQDHRGDFQVAANKALGGPTEIDWTDVRVICLAPSYKKYDLHAVKMMGANIELWQYKLLESGHLYIEEVFRKSGYSSTEAKDPVYVEAGKKAAITRQNGNYNIEEHVEVLDASLKETFEDIREFVRGLDDSIEEVPKKFYIAYKASQNFVCLQTAKNKLTLFLKIEPKDVKPMPANGRDVSEIGHYGTGNFELIIRSPEDFEASKDFIKWALRNVGE